MSITTEEELNGMKRVSEAVALTLAEMRNHTKAGMTAKELDDFGGKLLKKMGAKSAPKLTYGFPGWTCIGVNNEIAHGIPTQHKIFREGDLINIDVSAEMNGFWSDNGGSFVLGADVQGHQQLVNASKKILKKAIDAIRTGVRITEIGGLIEKESKALGYTVIRNLTGHGIGRGLHEEPKEIANYYESRKTEKFKKNSVVAIETFISTKSTIAITGKDGWTLTGNKGGFTAQHEHTIVVTDDKPIVLTHMNGVDPLSP
ncbi:MAG: type I methionyl aminopeptidase [Chitinophagaceae bacterium]